MKCLANQNPLASKRVSKHVAEVIVALSDFYYRRKDQ